MSLTPEQIDRRQKVTNYILKEAGIDVGQPVIDGSDGTKVMLAALVNDALAPNTAGGPAKIIDVVVAAMRAAAGQDFDLTAAVELRAAGFEAAPMPTPGEADDFRAANDPRKTGKAIYGVGVLCAKDLHAEGNAISMIRGPVLDVRDMHVLPMDIINLRAEAKTAGEEVLDVVTIKWAPDGETYVTRRYDWGNEDDWVRVGEKGVGVALDAYVAELRAGKEEDQRQAATPSVA